MNRAYGINKILYSIKQKNTVRRMSMSITNHWRKGREDGDWRSLASIENQGKLLEDLDKNPSNKWKLLFCGTIAAVLGLIGQKYSFGEGMANLQQCPDAPERRMHFYNGPYGISRPLF